MKNIPLLLIYLLCISFTVIDLKPINTDNAVTFVIKNFGINTKGEFKGLEGSIRWDADNPSNSLFNISVDVATINTGIDLRDTDLKKESYFNVEQFPNIKFVSTEVTPDNIKGDLTIKGITKLLSFPYTVTPSGEGYLFEGAFSINRRDFHVGGNSFTLSETVDVTLKVQANP